MLRSVRSPWSAFRPLLRRRAVLRDALSSPIISHRLARSSFLVAGGSALSVLRLAERKGGLRVVAPCADCFRASAVLRAWSGRTLSSR